MGRLGPFYSLTDLAYVGGGFGKGVHSLLEAAYSGAPTASGPNGFDRSWEGKELQKRARVTMVFSPRDVKEWLEKATHTGKFPGLNWGGASQSFFAHVFQKLHP
jgi:3-deoxy-D-manno-octulosonic-acid transferase